MVTIGSEQRKAIDQLQNGNILIGGVGSGKSRTSLAYFVEKVCRGTFDCGDSPCDRPETPRDLYIITTAKKRDSDDWESEAEAFGIVSDPNKSYGGIRMVVDSWNNIKKYLDVEDAFFIFDEQRLVGGGAWVKAFLKIAKKNEWILLSATPGDTWMDYVPVFIANGFYRNRTDFYDRHVVWNPFTKFRQVQKYIGTGVLTKRLRSITVDIEYHRHTQRVIDYLSVEYDKDVWDIVAKDRWNPYENRPVRESGELAYLMRIITNRNESRLYGLYEIIKAKKKVILFYNYSLELDFIKNFLEHHDINYSEWNGQRHEPIPKVDSWVYLVQYASGAEGWNCIETDTIVFYSLNYSYRATEQAMGRIDRRNTPFTELYYYFFVSKSPIDLAIRRSLTKKQKFNENIFVSDYLNSII